MRKNIFGSISSRFMKAVHIQLSHEAVNFSVSKKQRKDDFLKFVDIFNSKFLSGGSPEYNF